MNLINLRNYSEEVYTYEGDPFLEVASVVCILQDV